MSWQRTGREKETKGKKLCRKRYSRLWTIYRQKRKHQKIQKLSYQRDLRKLAFFLKEHGIEKPEQVNATVLNSYLIISGTGAVLPGDDLTQYCGDPHVLPVCMSGRKNDI